MKNILVALSVLLAVSSCKKEESSISETENTKSETAPAPEIPEVTEPFKQIEITPVQAAEILRKQNNDTLYVTNFFATWCGPCMREIPHFKEKMREAKSQPVKFTFIGIDAKEDWPTKVKAFAEEQNLSKNIVLLDSEKLTLDFFPANFKQWDGGSIPFTFMRKGDQTDETIGMMTKEILDEKMKSFK